MENFDHKGYRDNLAKDLKDIRKDDPELAKKVLQDEKERRINPRMKNDLLVHDVLPPSTRYKMAAVEHKKERKEIQEESPVILARREENKKLDLEKRIKIGGEYKEIYMNFLDRVDKKFNEFEPKFIASLHSVLAKNSDRFIYDIHTDNDLWVSLDGERVTEDSNNSALKKFKEDIDVILKDVFSPDKDDWQKMMSEQYKARDVQFLPEFQNDIEGESVGIIKTKNLYINPRYATEGFILCSRSKEELIKDIKGSILREKKQE